MAPLAAPTFNAPSSERLTRLRQDDSRDTEAIAQDEAFWELIQREYTQDSSFINIESGYFSPAADVVLNAQVEWLRLINRIPSFYMRRRMASDRENLKRLIGRFAGLTPDEFVIARNTTEALNTIIHGIPLERGEEVLYNSREYPSMQEALEQRSQRYGMVNQVIEIPWLPSSQDEIVQAYADAMPGYDVYGFEYYGWYHYDALHCRVMGIFDPGMLRLAHRPFDPEVYYDTYFEINAGIENHSGAGLIPGESKVHWRLDGDPVWQETPLVRTTEDLFVGWIPGQVPGSSVHYYLSARDSSGREETLPPTAPAAYYEFDVIGHPTAARPPGAVRTLAISSFPNPSNGDVFSRLILPESSPVTVNVFDVAGRLVRTLLRDVVVGSGKIVQWDGRDDQGHLCPSGVYLLSLRQGSAKTTSRCVLVR